jgi:hypothetical protein
MSSRVSPMKGPYETSGTGTALGLHPSLERERHRLEARVRVRACDQATVHSVIQTGFR